MNKKYLIITVLILIVIAGAAIYFASPKKNMTDTTTQQTSFDIQGMKVEILQQGTGGAAKNGDLVTVNYTGSLLDGTKFDSSVDPSFGHVTPFQFSLPGQVIQGWNLGVVGMKVGEKRKLTIPAELAYGPQSPSPLIPPNSSLIFEVDLLKIN